MGAEADHQGAPGGASAGQVPVDAYGPHSGQPAAARPAGPDTEAADPPVDGSGVQPDVQPDDEWSSGWSPEAELERVQAERDQYLDRLVRLQADFDNFRKRSQRDQAANAERLVEGLVAQLLPVLDSLDLALISSEGSTPETDRLRAGFELVYAELLGVLERTGLERITATEVPFDPEQHEGVLQVDEGRSEPTVVEVLRTGYRYKQRVVRPAMVRVAR